jgi:hypothetical protein
MTALPAPGSTSRTQIKRLPEKTVTDREIAYAILDAGLMAHVAVVTDGQPYVVPVGYARRGDEVIFHGSSASRLFRTLAFEEDALHEPGAISKDQELNFSRTSFIIDPAFYRYGLPVVVSGVFDKKPGRCFRV